ncbi:MAG: NAD(P)/FAD-dependent oxidoreductase [Blastocatellia bacterium]|nr:NAD(P)/FAD-dependent oxidoreductase [Chloracidobacterium sp.]MBL8185569.1 NAD(P)/FAD-dependent oxidoreductase [Blastocatellia bacterium]HRJ87369.1 NAD(P)/FAD-dependent oxidoreductase [Pyrinomonadaceae bacterium]HRK49896.1 NAD(P)/FAD-dependent oxidoreductase [Pyrinomonadaceae bacterium]
MGTKPKVIIIGGGFGGLWAAKALANRPVDVILIDRKNHHVFQPLLYQVATAVLSPGEIAYPIRRILNKADNIEVILGEVTGFSIAERSVTLDDGTTVGFDYLIVAAGARHAYFGHDDWETLAPGLKTIEDAVEIRRRIFLAFELAERKAALTGEHDPLNFVVVGGGPTGVELAGAIADIARQALKNDFKAIDTTKARVMLFEGSDRVLGSFASELSESAKTQLEDLGVEVNLNSFVTHIEPGRVKVGEKCIDCEVVLWATGVAASPLGKQLGVETDKAGRVKIENDLSLGSAKYIFVIGDMASLMQRSGEPVPGVSPAAMQMGTHAAKNILADIDERPRTDFEYVDKGTMATIGRSKAIADVAGIKTTGLVAWLFWLFLHVFFLIGFRNRLVVLASWFWAYLTRERSARLITGDAHELRDALLFLEGPEAVKVIDRFSHRTRSGGSDRQTSDHGGSAPEKAQNARK